MLEDRVEAQGDCLGTEPVDSHTRVGVFCGEHGFPRGDKGEQLTAPTLVEALLCQGLVEIGQQVGHLIGVILQADGEATGMGFVGQPNVVP